MAKNINTMFEPVENTTEIEAPYELPDGWKWYKIQDFVDIFLGLTHTPEYVDNGIPFLSVKDMSSGYIDFSNTKYISEEEYKGLPRGAKPKQGDILFARAGTIGIPQIIDTDRLFGIFVSLGFFRLKQEKLYTKKFIIHWMNSILFEHQVNANIKGSTIKNLNTGWLKEFYIPLPPTLEEQQRIVNRIETLFAKLDQAKEKAQNVVDTFETRKASILHKAFTGEFTKKWRAENGVGENQELELIKKHAEQLSKKDILNINTFQESVEDFILDDGTIWKKCQIGAIGIVTNGSTPSRKEPSYWNGTIPWVSSGEVANNIIEFTNECISEEGFNNSSVKKLPVGTVLIAMIGEGKTRGQSSVLNIEATTNQNIAAIVIDHGRVEPKLLWYWLQKEYKNNREAGNGSGPQALNCQRVRELSFILPTLPEQIEIVHILDTILEKETKAKEAAEAVLEQINLLKKSILARAFRGEI